MSANRFHRLLSELRRSGTGQMLFLGDSMAPVLLSGSVLTYRVCESYEVGDIVFCRVNGRYIDAHRIVAKADDGRYLIASHAGRENGWTREVFAKAHLRMGRLLDALRTEKKGKHAE